jgi:cellulose biosynthesis protein BcsQ
MGGFSLPSGETSGGTSGDSQDAPSWQTDPEEADSDQHQEVDSEEPQDQEHVPEPATNEPSTETAERAEAEPQGSRPTPKPRRSSPRRPKRSRTNWSVRRLLRLACSIVVITTALLIAVFAHGAWQLAALIGFAAAGVFFVYVIFRSPLRRMGRRVGDRTRFGATRKQPITGLNGWIYQKSGQRWNLGPAPWKRWALATAIILVVPLRSIMIAIYTRTGGQGKTTTALTVAMDILEAIPGISVLLIGVDPAGTLEGVSGVKRESIQAFKEGKYDEVCFTLLEAIKNLEAWEGNIAEVRRRFATMPGTGAGPGSGLFVLSYPENEMPDPVKLRKAIRSFRGLFAYIVSDCNQYIGDFSSSTQVVLEEADVVGVPMTYKDPERITGAAQALNDLEDERFRRYQDRTVLVVNKVWNNLFHRGTTRGVSDLQTARKEQGNPPYEGFIATLPLNWGIKRRKRFLFFRKTVHFLVKNRSLWFRLYARELTAALVATAIEAQGGELRAEAGVPVEDQTPVRAGSYKDQQPALTGPSPKEH